MARLFISRRSILEDSLPITIQDLVADGAFRNNSYDGMLDVSAYGGQKILVKFHVVRESNTRFSIGFSYSIEGDQYHNHHSIDFFPLHFGGGRYYFLCHDTEKRVTALYFHDGYFSSRHHHSLVYRSSRVHRGRFELADRAQDLKRKAARLSAQGHPRKAREMQIKANVMGVAALKQCIDRHERFVRKMKSRR